MGLEKIYIRKKRIQKDWFGWLSKLFFISFLQTLALLFILFILERTEIFEIRVIGINEKILNPYESGGFFFGLILISDLIEEIFRYLVIERRKRKKMEKE